MAWKLFEGDCLELMPSIPDKSIDMILCDLPYGTTKCKWDTIIPFKDLWCEYERVIKDNGVILLFGSEPFSSALRFSNIKLYRYDWKWLKNLSGSFALAKKRPMKYHEDIIVFYRKQPTYNPQFREYSDSMKKRHNNTSQFSNQTKGEINNSLNNIQGIKRKSSFINFERGAYPKAEIEFKAPHTANGKRLHPTQKPVKLFEYLIKTYTNENDLILDNCAGSGTTGVASYNLNRNCIMIEQEPEYCDIIKKRMAELETQPSLMTF